jgi:ATP-dependent RNA helicase RhlE
MSEVTFASFNLDPRIQRALDEKGYVTPTPIQAQAIPHVLKGIDVMGAAQTGTGKTAAFTLPILQRMLPYETSSPSPAKHPVRALMLAPTRELADQIAVNVAQYATHTQLKSACVFGGVDMKPQTALLRAGVEILIATPGRLLDHIESKNTNLSSVSVLVLDEADRMLDMGFLPDLQRIVNLCPKTRQTLLFSATFSPEIRRLAESFQRDPVTVEVARRNATADNVTQQAYSVKSDDKRTLLVELLQAEDPRQVLVFSNSKLETGRLARFLVREGFKADAIHGDKSQNERLAALAAFKAGECEVLVATDVAARGLDIAELPCVINFDVPYNAEDYVHRIGRTGRAGASGRTIMLVSDDQMRAMADIEKLIKRKFELIEWAPQARSPARERRRREHVDHDTRTAVPVVGQAFRPSGDPFFSRPYEEKPADAAQSASAAAPAPARNSWLTRPKRPIPALLGGGGKS